LEFAIQAAEPDWNKLNRETLRHYRTPIQVDTSWPPDFEAPAAEYLRKTLEAEEIAARVFAKDPKRPVVARINGNGSKRPVLIMAHTNVVGVQREKRTCQRAGEGGFEGAFPRYWIARGNGCEILSPRAWRQEAVEITFSSGPARCG
jgi:hypothetical protein